MCQLSAPSAASNTDPCTQRFLQIFCLWMKWHSTDDETETVLSKMLFLYPITVWTCYQITFSAAKCFYSCFSFVPSTFTSLCCLVTTFWDIFQPPSSVFFVLMWIKCSLLFMFETFHNFFRTELKNIKLNQVLCEPQCGVMWVRISK